NLAGFVEITDALGGVPVCLNAPVRESRSGIDLPAGRQLVRGPDALAFVRQRRGLDDGDIDSIGRQQAFLAGLTSTDSSSDVLGDPGRVGRLARAVGRYVVLDRGWDVATLVGQLQRVGAGDLVFETVPTGSPALQTPVDGIAVEIDADEVRAFVQARMPGAAHAPQRPGATASTTSRPGTSSTPGPATRRSTTPSTSPRVQGPATTAVPAPAGASPARPSATSLDRPSVTRTAAPITADGVPCVD
ncbi:MAG: LCP family glycopolymer transferase, partial [Pseudonocardia sp.]